MDMAFELHLILSDFYSFMTLFTFARMRVAFSASTASRAVSRAPGAIRSPERAFIHRHSAALNMANNLLEPRNSNVSRNDLSPLIVYNVFFHSVKISWT
jgi:hypothetical protein